MKKIKDRVTLGIVSGLIGTAAQTLSDELFLRTKISQRSFRETASGIFVNKRKQAISLSGQVLGTVMNLAINMTGSIVQVNLLTKTGKDNLIPKGAFFGVSFGSLISAMMSGFATNKVQPKDARSNLSYVISNTVFGLATTFSAVALGDESLWDTPPENDYLQPTIPTSLEEKRSQPVVH